MQWKNIPQLEFAPGRHCRFQYLIPPSGQGTWLYKEVPSLARSRSVLDMPFISLLTLQNDNCSLEIFGKGKEQKYHKGINTVENVGHKPEVEQSN